MTSHHAAPPVSMNRTTSTARCRAVPRNEVGWANNLLLLSRFGNIQVILWLWRQFLPRFGPYFDNINGIISVYGLDNLLALAKKSHLSGLSVKLAACKQSKTN
uniref:Uncharacterized protein n=1 Tax=Romanomermis culicivorax TaxID=13658 RepID=A0A915JX61_ROMCU